MIFTTHWFILFAAAAVTLFWIIPKGEFRLWFLAAACLIFHAHFAGPAGMIPILALMVVTYFAGRSRDRRLCLLAMFLTVGTLCFYKYVLFFIGATIGPLNASWAAILSKSTSEFLPGAPPLGVSFFAFEFVHYLYDVRRGSEPIRSPVRFLLFSIFFPSLVAGPIKRYEQFIPEIERASRERASIDQFGIGMGRIALGYFKKVVLADSLTWYVTQNSAAFDTLGWFSRWIFVGALGLRILFDFSGYSDIAIGTAQLLGVRLPENFNWPYAARSLQDFWQRWHISLTSWIRDYVYIPLGGNRHGPVRRFANALLAFGLCGLWHGPAWHFVVWGLFHGVGLGIAHIYRRIPFLGTVVSRILEKESSLPWIITQVYVGLGWLLFFYPLPQALHMARRLMFGA